MTCAKNVSSNVFGRIDLIFKLNSFKVVSGLGKCVEVKFKFGNSAVVLISFCSLSEITTTSVASLLNTSLRIFLRKYTLIEFFDFV